MPCQMLSLNQSSLCIITLQRLIRLMIVRSKNISTGYFPFWKAVCSGLTLLHIISLFAMILSYIAAFESRKNMPKMSELLSLE